MGGTNDDTSDMGFDELKIALHLSPHRSSLHCWAGVLPGVTCRRDLFGRLPRVLDLLDEICKDIATYNAVKQSIGIPELLHRLAVELLCDEPHPGKSQDKLTVEISTILRERLDKWEAARLGIRLGAATSTRLKFQQRNNETQASELIGVIRRSNLGARAGYVYCFSDRNTQGYLKIGFAAAEDVPGRNPSPDYEDRFKLWKRLSDQVATCKFDMKLEFDEYMPCGGQKIEALVHATLRAKAGRILSCKTPKCHTQHKEWFRATREEVKAYIRMWKRFSSLRPWADSGCLLPQWDARAVAHLREYGKMPVREWVEKYWKWVIHDGEIENNPEVQRLEASNAVITQHLQCKEEEIAELENAKIKGSSGDEVDSRLLYSKKTRNVLEAKREVHRVRLGLVKMSLARKHSEKNAGW